MFWRLLLVLFGLTFLANGAAILSDDDCKYVDLGGSRRVITYTCHSSGILDMSSEAIAERVNAYATGTSHNTERNPGDLSGGVAGGLGVAIGSGMILLAIWPVIQRFSGNRQSGLDGSGDRSLTPIPEPSSSTQTTSPTLSSSPSPQTGVKGPACSNCDAAVSESAKFCPECGQPIEDPSCPKCGAEPPEGAAFCDQCGTDLKAEA